MGLADWIRIARGNLTPEEQAERDALARQRRLKREAQAKQQARAAQEAAERDAAVRNDNLRHPKRMETAVGLGAVEFVCHADTWQRVAYLLSDTAGWSTPTEEAGRVDALDGNMVRVHLSGQQVSLILMRMRWVARDGYAGSAALARRVYRAFAAVVDQVDPDAPTATPVPPVVLDDRVGVRRTDDETPADR